MITLSEHLGRRPVIAVLRAPTAERFADVCRVLVDEGFLALELTMTTAGALDAIRAARQDLPPEVLIGAGTVRTREQLDAAIAAGAQFAVSQITDPVLVAAAAQAGVPFVPGALTPTEIVAAHRLGVQAVKVSPVGPVGGVSYVSELVGPLPDVPLFPTGGVRIDEVGAYLAAGSAMVGLSRDLLRDVFAPGASLAGLRVRAARVIQSLDPAQP